MLPDFVSMLKGVESEKCACCRKPLATAKVVIAWDGALYCSMDCAEKICEDVHDPEEINPADLCEYGCTKCGKIFEDEYVLTRTDNGNVCADCMEE